MNNAVGPQVRSAKPKPSKLLPILGGVSLVGGLQAATQFFAYTFQYHASLGANLGHVYAPWSILNWSAKWYSQYPDEIMRAGSIGMVIGSRASLSGAEGGCRLNAAPLRPWPPALRSNYWEAHRPKSAMP